jgi:hypothetical protein
VRSSMATPPQLNVPWWSFILLWRKERVNAKKNETAPIFEVTPLADAWFNYYINIYDKMVVYNMSGLH